MPEIDVQHAILQICLTVKLFMLHVGGSCHMGRVLLENRIVDTGQGQVSKTATWLGEQLRQACGAVPQTNRAGTADSEGSRLAMVLLFSTCFNNFVAMH